MTSLVFFHYQHQQMSSKMHSISAELSISVWYFETFNICSYKNGSFPNDLSYLPICIADISSCIISTWQ